MIKNILKDENIKIVLTGGHAGATIFAVTEEIKSEKSWKIYFIGGKSSFEGKNIQTLASVNKVEGIEHYFITSGRLQRKFTKWTIPSLLKIPVGFFQSFNLLLKIKPNIVFSFGGYAAFPVVVSAWVLRIPVIIHEQTAAAGRANIYSSVFATKILLSRKTSLPYFNRQKCEIIGNPISKGIINIENKFTKSDPPALLIQGGAGGSVTINETIGGILEKLLQKFRVIHQTGELDYEKFSKVRSSLAPKLQNNYEIYPVVKSSEWHKLLAKADILVSRAGANITSEIISIKIPSILIPLPIAYLDEQYKNARFVESFGLAKIIPQSELTPGKLYEAIQVLNKDWSKIKKHTKDIKSPDTYAAGKTVDIINKLI